jgi:hypothetical protein
MEIEDLLDFSQQKSVSKDRIRKRDENKTNLSKQQKF